MNPKPRVHVTLIIRDGHTGRALSTYTSRPLPRGAAGRRFDRLLTRVIVKCIMRATASPRRKT